MPSIFSLALLYWAAYGRAQALRTWRLPLASGLLSFDGDSANGLHSYRIPGANGVRWQPNAVELWPQRRDVRVVEFDRYGFTIEARGAWTGEWCVWVYVEELAKN